MEKIYLYFLLWINRFSDGELTLFFKRILTSFKLQIKIVLLTSSESSENALINYFWLKTKYGNGIFLYKKRLLFWITFYFNFFFFPSSFLFLFIFHVVFITITDSSKRENETNRFAFNVFFFYFVCFIGEKMNF